MRILTINTGSSSIKAALYDMNGGERRLLSFAVAGIGHSSSQVTIEGGDDGFAAESAAAVLDCTDHDAALQSLFDAFAQRQLTFDAVGHRIVYGGPDYHQPMEIDATMLSALRAFAARDPQHMPQALRAADTIAKQFPAIRQVACFDTAFHHDMPDLARKFALPQRYFDSGIRRYGFHGLSYEYILGELRRLDSQAAAGRVIVAHLGSGSSMAAVLNGKSIDTSMGLTPESGLVMSKRTGDIDAAVVWHLVEAGMTLESVRALIGAQSGLLGISGSSGDMRHLLAVEDDDSRAREAVATYCYAARKYLGAYVAALGGLDTLVFTGGVGERASQVRERICERLQCFGIQLDATRNRQDEAVISSDDSAVKVRVIQTDEGLIVARHAARVAEHHAGES